MGQKEDHAKINLVQNNQGSFNYTQIMDMFSNIEEFKVHRFL